MSGERTGGQGKRYTVAELIAREAANQPLHGELPPDTARKPLPAIQLLHREGLDFAGADSPNVKLAAAPVHVSALLSREGAGQQAKGRSGSASSRIAAIGSAVAICGLTAAGIIAMKPTAESPTAGPQDESKLGPASPTNVEALLTPTSNVLERASSDMDRGGAGATSPIADAPSASGSGGSTAGSAGSAPTATTRAAAPADPAPQPTKSQPSPSQPSPQQPPAGGDEGSGGALDPVTEPVCELLDPACDTLDPVIGGVNDTVGGLLP